MKKSIKDLCKIKEIPSKGLFFIVTFFFAINGTVNCQTIVTNVSPRYSVKETRIFKDSVVLKGDWGAYLDIDFIKDKDYPKFSDGNINTYELMIPYALVLANRYDNAQACHDIYIYIKRLYDHYHLELDEGTREFLIFYLKKGADLGNPWCKEALEELNKETAQ